MTSHEFADFKCCWLMRKKLSNNETAQSIHLKLQLNRFEAKWIPEFQPNFDDDVLTDPALGIISFKTPFYASFWHEHFSIILANKNSSHRSWTSVEIVLVFSLQNYVMFFAYKTQHEVSNVVALKRREKHQLSVHSMRKRNKICKRRFYECLINDETFYIRILSSQWEFL